MKLVLPLALLVALLAVPFANAAPDVRVPCSTPSGIFCTVGPCTAGSSYYWPGYAFLLVCYDSYGNEIVFVADYTCNGGLNGVGLRVFGRGFDCISGSTLQDLFQHSLA